MKEFNVHGTLRAYSVTISKVSEGTSHRNKGFPRPTFLKNSNLVLFGGEIGPEGNLEISEAKIQLSEPLDFE